tara:strand:+ start:149644 stop:150741 length:1098 start_codon:yes stop_codon:yes gene_type:complete
MGELYASPTIRVLIGSNLKQVSVSGLDLVKKASGKEKVYPGQKSFTFNCAPLKKHKSLKNPLLLTKITSRTGLVSLENSKYRGSIQLVAPKSPKGCDVVNELSLETYIGSVLAKEMNPNWPIEALKAQAVAARSYAFFKIRKKRRSRPVTSNYYDLENSEKHQVNGDFFDVTFNASKAQRMTKGEVLSFKNQKLVPVFFHSKCGGKTRTPDQVWSNKVEGYESVECKFCHNNGVKDWKKVLPKKKLYSAVDRALKYHRGLRLDSGVAKFKVAPGTQDDTHIRVYDNDRLLSLKKSRVRSTLGRRYTLSNTFSVTDDASSFTVQGRGFGHGVGLCQFGALEMAKRGYTYRQILKHYFPSLELKKIY